MTSKPLMSADEFHALCYQSTRASTDAEQALADLLPYVSQIASDRQDKGTGRSKIADYIRASMPLAQREGRTQVLVLGAAHPVVENGGMRGDPLAPVTLYEYFRCARRPNFDHPRRQNIDQGWKPVSIEAGCG